MEISGRTFLGTSVERWFLGLEMKRPRIVLALVMTQVDNLLVILILPALLAMLQDLHKPQEIDVRIPQVLTLYLAKKLPNPLRVSQFVQGTPA